MAKQCQVLAERQRLLLEMAQPIVYKPDPGGEALRIHFYFPKDLKEKPGRSLLLFFPAGAFDRINPIQFAPHALHFVDRGAVCGLVEYRNRATHPAVTPSRALQDGRTAMRFVRHYRDRLHIDPDRIALIGAGAGAVIAGSLALRLDIPDDPGDPEELANLSTRPDAAVLFSPIVEFTKGSYGWDMCHDPAEARLVSLARHIRGGSSPMQVFHGTLDRLIPLTTVERFVRKMRKKRNTCEFEPFEGRDNNYYNLNVDPASYEASLRLVEQFLVGQAFLPEAGEESDPRVISWREEDY